PSRTYPPSLHDALPISAVSMNMNANGTRIWKSWTAEVSGRTPKGRIAIVLDNTVYSAPSVNQEIPTGNSIISGNFTTEEATDLADRKSTRLNSSHVKIS